ncbi:hypothetical protein C0992_011131 [Termitomyces sp. T32_za158]|nr:hypothetical protein C0992_011131 [Termitomyces sp. T32_za158]
MPIDLAIRHYVLFCKKIFSDVKKWSNSTGRFKATVFESAMENILQSAKFSEDVLMQENDPPCKSFVVAFPSKNMTPRIFRTYQVGANQGSNCKVVQAARATTAAPDLFKPVSIIFGSGGLNKAEEFVENYINIPGLFYRLSVDQGLQKMPLDDWKKLGDIETHSKTYLGKAKVTDEVDSLVQGLYSPLQKATLKDLCK